MRADGHAGHSEPGATGLGGKSAALFLGGPAQLFFLGGLAWPLFLGGVAQLFFLGGLAWPLFLGGLAWLLQLARAYHSGQVVRRRWREPQGPAMTAALRKRPRTVAGLLFGTGEDALRDLARQILSADAAGQLGGALRKLPEAKRAAVAHEAAAKAAVLLDVDLIGQLLTGWRARRELVIAARRTLAAPGGTELIKVAAHRVTTSQQPSVTVGAGGREVITLPFGLRIDSDITDLKARISAGRLAAFHSGHCETTVTLAIQGTGVLTRRAHAELPGVIPVSPGLRLLHACAYAVAETPGEPALWRTSWRAS